MGDSTRIMCPERAHDLEGLREDANDAIGATEEDAFRTRDYGGYVSWLLTVSRMRKMHAEALIPLRGMSFRRPGA